MSKEEKFNNDIFVEKAIQLHKLYCEIYENDDLIGVSTQNIHINNERYFELFTLEESKKELSGDSIKYSSIRDGIKFITLKTITVDMVKDKI